MNEENHNVGEVHYVITDDQGPYMSPSTEVYLQALFDEMCALWYSDEHLRAIPPGPDVTVVWSKPGTLAAWLEQLSPLHDQVKNHYAPFLAALYRQYPADQRTPLALHIDNCSAFLAAAAMYNVVINHLWSEY